MPKPVVQVGDDPDPSEWLFISLEQKRIDQSKPYDAKKACWVPDEKEGFVLGEIKATKGELVTVGIPGGEVMNFGSKLQARMSTNAVSIAIVQALREFVFYEGFHHQTTTPNKMRPFLRTCVATGRKSRPVMRAS